MTHRLPSWQSLGRMQGGVDRWEIVVRYQSATADNGTARIVQTSLIEQV
jgi:hypothetical protein